jgi:hypothetical protein
MRNSASIAGPDSKYICNFWRLHRAVRPADTRVNQALEPPRRIKSTYMSNHSHDYDRDREHAGRYDRQRTPAHAERSGSRQLHLDVRQLRRRWAAQEIEVRIWVVIRYRFSRNVGAEQGMKLSRYVLENFMVPLDHDYHDGHEDLKRDGKHGR